MRRDDIIRMAREAGLAHSKPRTGDYDGGRIAGSIADLIRFVGLVAAAEREACIKVIEAYQIPVGNSPAGELACDWTYDALKQIRDEIRERGVK